MSDESGYSDPASGGDIGSSAPDSGTQGTSAAFMELADEKGVKKSWGTKEDFAKDWKKYGMLQSDYTRKTTELARQREEYEKQRGEQEKSFGESKSKYDKYNEFLKGNPHIYKQLEAAMRGGMPPEATIERANGYADEKFGSLEKELKSLQEWKTGREREESKTKLYSDFKSKYEDFDQATIEDALNTLQNGDSESVVELLYQASRGRGNASIDPMVAEAKLAEKLQSKQAGRMMPASGTGSKPPGSFNTIKEAREAAHRAHS